MQTSLIRVPDSVRRTTLCLVAGTLFTGAQVARADEFSGDFVYLGWPLHDTVILSRPDKAVPTGEYSTGAGDAVAAVRYCGESSPYECFVSSAYTFSVPKHWREGQTVWEFEEQVFEVIQEGRTVQLFGCRISDVALIRATTKPAPDRSASPDAFFYFSKTRGLVGFGMIPQLAKTKLPPADTMAGGWWLVNRLGFGATVTEDEARMSCR